MFFLSSTRSIAITKPCQGHYGFLTLHLHAYVRRQRACRQFAVTTAISIRAMHACSKLAVATAIIIKSVINTNYSTGLASPLGGFPNHLVYVHALLAIAFDASPHEGVGASEDAFACLRKPTFNHVPQIACANC